MAIGNISDGVPREVQGLDSGQAGGTSGARRIVLERLVAAGYDVGEGRIGN